MQEQSVVVDGVQPLSRRRVSTLLLAVALIATLVLGASLLGIGHSKVVASAAVAKPHSLGQTQDSLAVAGIPGDGTAHATTDIEVLSWQWGLSTPGATATGALKSGRANFQDLSITKFVDKASPLLFQACAGGQVIKTVTLYVMPKAGTAGDSSQVSLTNAHCGQVSNSNGGDRPTESISFTYQKITFDYKTAATGHVSHMGWDLAQNKKV
jgi:type VI secretion system secreted protein Hcp